MYESTFQFRERPFVAAPLTDRYFKADAIEQTLATLSRCIERAEGPALLAGPPGTGKSLVCHLLAEHFRDEYRVALLTSARLGSRRALLQNILYELGLPYRDLEEGELRLSLIDHLDPSENCPNGMLLLIDEAHTLPLRLLEEVRMITNLVRDGLPRVRLVLAGGQELEERFASPRLQSFQQRLAARCYLRALNREETRGYVRWQASEAGGDPDRLFAEGALNEVYVATGGIPRLINQLCDHALIMAAVGGVWQLDEAGVAEAWADLQQLPAPLYGTSASPTSSVVEFGQLSETFDDLPSRVGASATMSVQVISDPTVALDEIEELLGQSERLVIGPGSLSDEEFAEDDTFQPSGKHTEVELIFHEAHNPFGQHFEEEEIVIDRYASLESAANRTGRTRVTSDEGREIAAAISNHSSRDASTAVAVETISLAPVDMAELGEDLLDPACDPVLPEAGTRIAVEPRGARRAAVESNLRVATVDDRDAIVIDETRPDVDEEDVRPLGAVRRQEYRQLFARLRQG